MLRKNSWLGEIDHSEYLVGSNKSQQNKTGSDHGVFVFNKMDKNGRIISHDAVKIEL